MLYWPAFSLNYASDGVIMWKDEDFRKIKKGSEGLLRKGERTSGDCNKGKKEIFIWVVLRICQKLYSN